MAIKLYKGEINRRNSKMRPAFIGGKNVPIHQTDWGSLQWIINGPAGTSETMTVGRVTFKPRMANPHHMHPNCEEILYVVKGVIEHTVPDGDPVVLHPGDSIVIPKNVWHHATNVSDEEAEVIVMFDSAYRETVGEV
jgi:quercetin dioxygenase-like cupin family protein